MRDALMDFVNSWSEKTEVPICRFIGWLGVGRSKFYTRHARYGRVNEHNGKIPGDFWLEDWGKQAIVEFYQDHTDEGYHRLTFMMLDADVVAGAARRGAVVPLERQAIQEGDGLCAAAHAA